jgi:outer membrane protein assembly factor BamB
VSDEQTAEVAPDHAELPPPPPSAPPPPRSSASDASDAALARYRATMRRRRTIYYAVIAVVVAALGTWVGVAWSHGEVAHASLHTFAPAPPTVGVRAPSETQIEAWRTTDRIAIGVPQWGGTVITFSKHTVAGRDAQTGKRTWRYTRTDRVVCTAAQLTGTTVAIYQNKGNCDELSAFDSDTGRRRWTRTLDMDGMPVVGQPSYQVTPYTLLASTDSVIYAVDPITGYNRWTYERDGCRIEHVALGTSGALISQNCSDQVHCKNVKFCGRGPQLLLRDGSAGRGDDSKPNADQIKWNHIGDDGVPVSADQVLGSVDPSGRTLQVLDGDDGKRGEPIDLTPATPDLGPVTAIATDSAEIIWISGEAYAIRPDATSVEWHFRSSGPPTLVSTVKEDAPSLSTSRITVATSDGVGILDGNDGKLIQRFSVQPPEAGSIVHSLGTGFLVTGPTGIVAYR